VVTVIYCKAVEHSHILQRIS